MGEAQYVRKLKSVALVEWVGEGAWCSLLRPSPAFFPQVTPGGMRWVLFALNDFFSWFCLWHPILRSGRRSINIFCCFTTLVPITRVEPIQWYGFLVFMSYFRDIDLKESPKGHCPTGEALCRWLRACYLCRLYLFLSVVFSIGNQEWVAPRHHFYNFRLMVSAKGLLAI